MTPGVTTDVGSPDPMIYLAFLAPGQELMTNWVHLLQAPGWGKSQWPNASTFANYLQIWLMSHPFSVTAFLMVFLRTASTSLITSSDGCALNVFHSWTLTTDMLR